MASLDSLELKPEQKTVVEGIQTDLEKLGDASKEPRAKLEGDVADGITAGKLDHKKTDADITALATAVAATAPTMQDAMNRLYKTLDAAQRKKLVETMREKGKDMHQHMAEHEGMGKGPMTKDHEGMGKGPMTKDHEGMGESPLLKLADALALTPEQKDKLKTKLEAQMKANHATVKTKHEAAQKQLDAIGTAFEGDKFEAKKAGIGTLAPDLVKTMATQKVQFVETVLAVLTPEQRTRFAAHLKEHAHDMEEGG